MKTLLLSAAVMIVSLSSAQAGDFAVPLVEASKAYQSLSASKSTAPEKDADASVKADPASVEPAAGADAQGETKDMPETTRALQQSMKLPRKN